MQVNPINEFGYSLLHSSLARSFDSIAAIEEEKVSKESTKKIKRKNTMAKEKTNGFIMKISLTRKI